jgi:NADPH2:quinone reductase
MARAVVMRAFGGPEVLRVEELEPPPLAPGDIRIRTLAAAVNHSDLEVRSGAWPIRRPDPFPYVPGLEVVGEVIEIGGAVTGLRPGDRAITMMQGLGGVRSERPGGYQDVVTVAADAVAVLPADLDPLAAAALGLAAVTAHQGLAKLPVAPGARIAVTGAAGGVGSAACALAIARGAIVTALARPGGEAHLRSLGVAHVIVDPAALAQRSQDGVLDCVAGPLFEPLVRALADGGRLCVVGAMAGDRVGFEVWELLRDVSLTGYSSESLDDPALRAAFADLVALVRTGELAPPPYRTFPLARAAEAHALVEARGVHGRVLLVP